MKSTFLPLAVRAALVSAAAAPWLHGQAANPSPITNLETVRVSASRLAAADVEGPQNISSYDNAQIASTGSFSVEEFIASLPAPEEGTQQLVLVDGRPTFLDPSTLPMGMIEGIDVSRDGSMPNIGAYSTGRIINIRLKKNYVGGEVGGKYTGSFAGGGHQLTTRLSSTTTRGKLRTLVSLELQRHAALSAFDREFSREQDHRARGGQDLRLDWGYPAVVEAADGSLNGFPNGAALVPTGAGPGLTAAEFTPSDPAAGSGASNQRRFNTSPYRTLTSPSERASFNLDFTYKWSERIEASFSASHSITNSQRSGPPPVSRAASDTLVPAALNPFGEDVRVGLVHVGFGGTNQTSRSNRTDAGFQLNGRIGDDWEWDGSAGYRQNDSRQRTGDLDPDLFSAALRESDPTRRFDPFVDQRDNSINAGLYPRLTGERRSLSEQRSGEIDVSVEGPLWQGPGGPASLKIEAELQRAERTRVSNRVVGGPLTLSEVTSTTRETSASLNLPFFGQKNARTGLRRLELQLAGDQETSSDGGGETSTEVGVVWSPIKSLLFRARHAINTESPSRSTVAGSERIIGESLVDPRRGGETISEIQAITLGLIAAESEESERSSFGLTVEPSAIKGLRFSATYRVRAQHRLFQDDFDVQDILNNEAALAGRVTRDAASTDDQQLGWPGRVTSVDVTPGNTGEADRRDLEFSLEYRMPDRGFGTLRLTASAERFLSAKYEILPGVAFVQENGGGFRRPRWSGDALVAWSRQAWQASARIRHTGAIPATTGATNAIAAFTVTDLNVGYRFQPPVADGKRKKELRLTASIGNLFDATPPWADTVNGYRNGSPLGRTYSLAATLEF